MLTMLTTLSTPVRLQVMIQPSTTAAVPPIQPSNHGRALRAGHPTSYSLHGQRPWNSMHDAVLNSLKAEAHPCSPPGLRKHLLAGIMLIARNSQLHHQRLLVGQQCELNKADDGTACLRSRFNDVENMVFLTVDSSCSQENRYIYDNGDSISVSDGTGHEVTAVRAGTTVAGTTVGFAAGVGSVRLLSLVGAAGAGCGGIASAA